MNQDHDALLSFVIESSRLMEPHVFSMANELDNDFTKRWPRDWISFVDEQTKDPETLQKFESQLIQVLKSLKSDVPSNWPESLRQYVLQCQNLRLDRTVTVPQMQPLSDVGHFLSEGMKINSLNLKES
jgi:hypothetical protein